MRFTRGIGLPTSAREWRLVGRTTRLVLSNPRYALVAVGTSILELTVFSLSQNVQFVLDVLGFEFLSPLDKLYILLDQFPLIGTTYDLAQSLLLVLVAILTGLNLTIALYHVREHGLDRRSGGVGTLGTVLGVLGAGCAACGSAVLAGLLSLFGASSALLVLPLDGLEVLLVAIVMLGLSIYWLADGMRGGEINGCPVDL
ncbi:MAG: hypothetical protein ABEI57_01605 [Halapricum sp.]